MKILFLANSATGLYKFRKELLERLILSGHEVHICLPDDEYIEEMKKMGCVFHPCEFALRGTNPLSDLKQYSFYKKLLKEVKPDIVFTYTIKPNIYGGMACASLKVPYVANITGLGTAVETPGLMQKITVPLYRYGLCKAKKVFFQNAENRDFMLAHKVVKGAYDMLPGSGVNTAQYAVTDYPSDEKIRFNFIARIMKEKGIDQYLDAAKAIKEKYPNTEFHICGSCDEDYQGILDDLQKKEIIVYHGSVSDIAGVHKTSSCTVHPTYYPEGMSNVLLESCACGRPIITTDRAGCREIVDNGVNGFVVKQRDSADLIDKIEKFLALSNEERKQMGLAGRAKVEKEFDRQIVIDKYLCEMENI